MGDEIQAAPATPVFQPRQWLLEWLPVLLMIGLVLVARSTLADHYHVPSGSMEPSLMPGDHVLVSKSAYGYRIPFTHQILLPGDDPVRGDVVIFDSPEDGVRLIKRVVAVGGDEVAVRGGNVLIDGQPLRQSRQPVERYQRGTVPLNLEHGGGPDLLPVRVPDGFVLVLGDHRGNSKDGRYFGFVPVEALYGRARGVFWRSSTGPVWQPL